MSKMDISYGISVSIDEIEPRPRSIDGMKLPKVSVRTSLDIGEMVSAALVKPPDLLSAGTTTS